MFLKIGVLKNFVFTRKHLRWSLFSIIKTCVSYQEVRNVSFRKILRTYQMNDPLEVFSVSCWQQKSKTDNEGKYLPRFNRSFRSTLQNFKQVHHLRGIWMMDAIPRMWDCVHHQLYFNELFVSTKTWLG